jgi:hypothetical protein
MKLARGTLDGSLW